MQERPVFAIIEATNIRFQEYRMPKGIPLTEEDQAKRRHEIFHQVVNVFLKKGFQETSMREIAEAAGLGKSTLYDYFKTKDEILVYYFEDQLNDLTAEAQQMAMQNKSADERLREITQMHMELLQANKSLFLKMSMEAQRLKPESQRKIQEKRHAYQDLLRALIDEGIREGAFRKVDSLLAARILVTSLAPVVFTSRPTGTPQEMVKATLDIFFKGIETC
jgi:AcrR family transcriptional regulator